MVPSSIMFTDDTSSLDLNEADTIKSSSVLIYYYTEQSIYARMNGSMPELIKGYYYSGAQKICARK
jgi:hypothetical protein